MAIDALQCRTPEDQRAGGSPAAHPLEVDRMRDALDAAGIGVWEYDPRTGDTRRSGAYDAIYGYPGGFTGVWDANTCLSHVHEEDRCRVAAEWGKAITGCEPMRVTYRIRRACDGAVRWVEAHGAPRSAEGAPLRFVGTLADVTEQREREQQREMVVGEMRHRVKNILANVQALAVNTGRRSQSIDEFLAAFGGRLSALAQAHDVAVSQSAGGASLTSVIRAAVEPWAKGGQIRTRAGCERVSARQAVALSLALHELATNAVKYGALSRPSGEVKLVAEPDADGAVRLTWQEEGGPRPTQEPARAGFGGKLLRHGLPAELAGSIDLTFPPEGARCVLRFPVLAPPEAARPPRAPAAVHGG